VPDRRGRLGVADPVEPLEVARPLEPGIAPRGRGLGARCGPCAGRPERSFARGWL